MFQVRGVAGLGNCAYGLVDDGLANRRGVAVGGEPRCAHAHLVDYDSRRRLQRLANTGHASAAVHSVNQKRVLCHIRIPHSDYPVLIR